MIKRMNAADVERTKEMDLLRAQLVEQEMLIEKLTTFMGLSVHDLGDGVYEVVKEDMATGDYTDPIAWADGGAVTTGLWYYTDDKDLPHEAIADGVPEGFNDHAYFDFIE